MPKGAEWIITAELRTPKGEIVARVDGLCWAGTWARDSHHAALGHAFKTWLNTALRRAGMKADAEAPAP